MGVRQVYKFCDSCEKVVRVDEPECYHFGKPLRNTESVTVVFRGPDGKTSIPWEPNAKCPSGYVREEIRGAAAVRRLERELDAKDLQRHRASEERKQALQAPIIEHHRENLKQIVREGKHPFQRELAREALRRSERGYSSNYSADNHRD